MSIALKPQTKLVLGLLRIHPEGLTALEALRYGAGFRLSGRILELRQAGYHVETEWLTTPNRARIARYVLRDEIEQMVVGL
jgi:hypothetical protein